MRCLLAGLACVFLLGGCASREAQLHRVAKDWCQVIRASQVIPVYPLTEDLVPGDVFLVRMSIPHQHREYENNGFLPMDQAMTRLQGLDFVSTYQKSHGIAENTPYHWLFPPPPPPAPAPAPGPGPTTRPAAGGESPGGQNGSSSTHRSPTAWAQAPRAAFPSYTFEVDAAGGIQAALPIKGVPVGLGIMQTDRAYGSVTLSDTYTYGVPFDKLVAAVHLWAEKPLNKAVLQDIRAGVNQGNGWAAIIDDVRRLISLNHNERTVYLRVVSRVYLIGKVDVTLLNARAGSADLQVGAPREVALLNPAYPPPAGGAPAPAPPPPVAQPPAAPGAGPPTPVALSDPAAAAPDPKNPAAMASNYQAALEAVTRNLGGRIKLEWATRRSVAMEETFDRPLVIGYLGFDFPVMEDGRLGTPIATAMQLDSGGQPRLTEAQPAHYGPDASSEIITTWVADEDSRNRLKVWLAGHGFDMGVPALIAAQEYAPLRLIVIEELIKPNGGSDAQPTRP